MSSTKKAVVIVNDKPRKCPKCGNRLNVRSSRLLADKRHRVRYAVCASEHCGYTEKQLVALF